MLFVLSTLAAPPPSRPPEATFEIVVFDRAPPLEQRQRLVRRVMKKSRPVESGKDWGRVLCFQFAGPSEPDVVQKAVAKVGLRGEVRSVDDCVEPPKEALLPPEPIAVRKVVFTTPVAPNVARDEMRYLFDVDLGISGLHVARTESRNACIELQKDLDNEQIFFLLQASELPVERVENVSSCAVALSSR